MNILNILKAAYFTPVGRSALGGIRWGANLVFIGPPGGGKTSVLSAFAKSISYGNKPAAFYALKPSDGEGQFGVIPVPQGGADPKTLIETFVANVQAGMDYEEAMRIAQAASEVRLTFPAHEWVKRFNCSHPGVVFNDEYNTGGPTIQAAQLALMDSNRSIGAHYFHGRVRVFGAMNPPEMAANGNDLAIALSNRNGWINWGYPTVEEHASYMMGIDDEEEDAATIDGDAEEARVLAAWRSGVFAQAVGLEVAFHRSNAGMFKNVLPQVGEATTTLAYPSDRTWEMATRADASSRIHGLSAENRDTFIASFIGPKAYEAKAIFDESADLPPIVDVADGKVPFAWEPKRLDRSAAIVAAWTTLVKPKSAEKRIERAERLWDALDGATALDITVPAAQQLCKAGLHVSKAARPVLEKLFPAMQTAGIKGEVV
jgi:MoxR-like ATPase